MAFRDALFKEIAAAEVKVENGGKRFHVGRGENVRVTIELMPDYSVSATITTPPTSIGWHIDGKYAGIRPMALRGEEALARSVELIPELHEEMGHREANRLALMGFALTEIERAIRVAAFSQDVDQEMLDHIARRFSILEKLEVDKIQTLLRKFAVDEKLRGLMEYVTGGIYNSISIKF